MTAMMLITVTFDDSDAADDSDSLDDKKSVDCWRSHLDSSAAPPYVTAAMTVSQLPNPSFFPDPLTGKTQRQQW